MALSHPTGLYNVQATVAAWLYERLTANKPALVTGAVDLRLTTPEDAINCPMWSVHFLGTDEAPETYQGHTPGTRQHGLCEVSCWVSRRDVSWRGQLLQMVDAVKVSVNDARSAGSAIIVKNFYASATAPTNTSYRITLEDIEVRQPPVDPNPDIERQRVLISFTWVERK